MDNETKAKGEMETTLGMEEALEELSEMCKHQNEQNESAELGLGYCVDRFPASLSKASGSGKLTRYCAGPCACA